MAQQVGISQRLVSCEWADVLRIDFEGRSIPAPSGTGIADAPRVDRGTRLPAEFVSDVALYYHRGETVRQFIRNRIEKSHPPVYLIAQGLAAIPATDLLVIQALPDVKGLITIGSPVPSRSSQGWTRRPLQSRWRKRWRCIHR